MTVYIVEFLKNGMRTELRAFRTMARMQAARDAWNVAPEFETRTTACYISDAEMKEPLA